MTLPLLRDERWPVARLIPITSSTGVEAKERNAASALLAVLSHVDEFGRTLLKPLGAPAGKIEAFVETPFKLETGKTIRPDGLHRRHASRPHVVGTSRMQDRRSGARRRTRWRATSTWPVPSASTPSCRSRTTTRPARPTTRSRSGSQEAPQGLDPSLVVGPRPHRGRGSEAAPRRQGRRSGLHPRRADPLPVRSTVWSRPIRRYGAELDEGPRRRSHSDAPEDRIPTCAAIANRWDELIRFLSLDLTKDLGRDVRQLAAPGSGDRPPVIRPSAASLAEEGRLYADLQIPDTAGALEIVADLSTRQVIVATELDAPKEGQSRGRLSWLLRQLQKAPPDLTVEVLLARTSLTLSAQLAARSATTQRSSCPIERARSAGFRVSLSRDLGLNRQAGRGSFIDSVLTSAKSFYGEVLQQLTAWKPSAPKLRPAEGPIEREAVDVPGPIEVAIERADQEMEEATSPPEPGW